MKRYLCLFVSCLFFGLSEIDALTWVKSKDNVCTETEEYNRWKKLPDSKKDNYFMPIRCEEFLKRDKSITSTSLGNPFNVDYKTAKKFTFEAKKMMNELQIVVIHHSNTLNIKTKD